MSSIVYTTFKGKLFNGSVDLDNDTFKVVLLNSSYDSSATSAEQSHSSYADVSAFEITGTGYTATGQALSSLSAYTDIATNVARWTAANVTWSTSTITARYASIYDVTDSNALVCTIDFVTDKSSSTGDFTIQWAATGILNLTD